MNAFLVDQVVIVKCDMSEERTIVIFAKLDFWISLEIMYVRGGEVNPHSSDDFQNTFLHLW